MPEKDEALACAMLERQYIGIDLSEAHCKRQQGKELKTGGGIIYFEKKDGVKKF